MKQPNPVNESQVVAKPSRKATPELSQAITGMITTVGDKVALTLAEVRGALQTAGTTWSQEGELLFPQDRTGLVIEVDELIDVYGAGASAADFVAISGVG